MSEASFFGQASAAVANRVSYTVAGRARRLAFLLRRRRSPKENMPRPASSKHERQHNSINGCFLDATHCCPGRLPRIRSG
jgi:hypothetical protein